MESPTRANTVAQPLPRASFTDVRPPQAASGAAPAPNTPQANGIHMPPADPKSEHAAPPPADNAAAQPAQPSAGTSSSVAAAIIATVIIFFAVAILVVYAYVQTNAK